MPRKRRVCLTPQNRRERKRRQNQITYNQNRTLRAADFNVHTETVADTEFLEIRRPGTGRARKNGPTLGIACNAQTFNESEVDPRFRTHECGEFSVVCEHCNAIRWKDETNFENRRKIS